MKRYITFISFLLVGAYQTFGQTSCAINSFYITDPLTPITTVTYDTPFKIDLGITLDGTPTDQLLIALQLPSNNYQNINGITANVTSPSGQTIATGALSVNGSILTIPVNASAGFQAGGFTVHLLNVILAPMTDCGPVTLAFNGTMKSSFKGTLNPFVATIPNANITGNHILGTISISSAETYNYNATTNANYPLYMDIDFEVESGTYIGSNFLFSLNSNQSITKVVRFGGTTFNVLTPNASGIYTYPLSYNNITQANLNYDYQVTFVRVYFNINNNNQSTVLNLNVAANFDLACTVSGNNFTKTVSSLNPITYKNDDQILQYPSIFCSDNSNSYGIDYNYNVDEITSYPCETNSAYLYLDNIYNAPLQGLSSPVTTTIDNLQNVLIESLIFDPEMLPVVSVLYVNSTNFQYVSYAQGNGNVITFQNPGSIKTIKMDYSNVQSKISVLQMNYSLSVAPGSFVYNLFNSGNPYITITKSISGQGLYNTPYINSPNDYPSIPSFGIGQPVTFTLSANIQKTIGPGVDLVYALSPQMYFPSTLNLLFSLDGSNYLPMLDFNTQHGTNLDYQLVGNTIHIKNISVRLCTSFFFKVNTQVVSRPTQVNSNLNSIYFSDYTTYASTFYWNIDITQSSAAAVTLSCDGAKYAQNMKLKTNDAFYANYTMSNSVAFNYTSVEVDYYIPLINSGVIPALSLNRIDGTSGAVTAIPLTATNSVLSYSSSSFSSCSSLMNNLCKNVTYTSNPASANILKVTLSNMSVNYYDQLVLTAQYPAGLALSGSIPVEVITTLGTVPGTALLSNPNTTAGTITIGTTSDCDPFVCSDCVTSFSPIPGNTYFLSAWVKESFSGTAPASYVNSGIQITFNNGQIATLPLYKGSGPIVEGWQRIEGSFQIPVTASNIQVVLTNLNATGGANVYFDDVRIHPLNSNMKSFVYNPSTQKLVAELDENNFATIYEYDDEGILIRVKKETERGVMTIKETRTNQSKIQTNKIQDQ